MTIEGIGSVVSMGIGAVVCKGTKDIVKVAVESIKPGDLTTIKNITWEAGCWGIGIAAGAVTSGAAMKFVDTTKNTFIGIKNLVVKKKDPATSELETGPVKEENEEPEE